MPVEGIGPREFQFQAFQALNSQKEDEVQKQDEAKDQSMIARLNAPQDNEKAAKEIFKLSVEKEQGKGINLNMMG
ncbi:MAG: hypothetical protein JW928_07665 [Candidatus Aureabacteria bacterium]|nr:hypothetical protein [Candidatus Auribacterota bacterium]